MNRINKVLEEKNDILSIYFTAGFPEIEDTEKIILRLSECEVDMIEIGLPFSDPLADGPTIQESSTIALNNGMNTKKLFIQLKNIRKKTDIPVCFTLDAGANVHVLFPDKFSSEVMAFIKKHLSSLCKKGKFISDSIGLGPKQI